MTAHAIIVAGDHPAAPRGGVVNVATRLLARLSNRTPIMTGDDGSTIYWHTHHRAFFELADEVNNSGAARKALDLWLEEDQQVDVAALKAATEAVERSEQSLEDALARASSVDEFINEFTEETRL